MHVSIIKTGRQRTAWRDVYKIQFEWCVPGISREIDNLQKIPLEYIMESVSYTHLAKAIRRAEAEREPSPIQNVSIASQLNPVSYTHLDVYKRQIQGFISSIMLQ